jgi:sugar/nucleoside kinase (ribokinase family)
LASSHNVPTLVAVGGLTIDYVQTRANLSGPAVGGNALYAAVGAWLVGSRPTILAKVGRDYPTELLSPLEAAGFDLGSIETVSGPSFKVVLDESTGERVQRFLPGSGDNSKLDPGVDTLPVMSDKVAHVCGIPVSTQRPFLLAMRDRAALTTFDTVVIPGQIEPRATELEELMDYSDVFLPSREEVAALWLVDDVDRWVLSQAQRGRKVVVKCGGEGAISVNENGDLIKMEAAPGRVVDTTGAGDAFCGAFASKLSSRGDTRSAMAWAAAAASVVIEGYGALHAVLKDRRGDVEDRAGTLLGAVQVERGGQ